MDLRELKKKSIGELLTLAEELKRNYGTTWI